MKPAILSVRRVWDAAPHCAFTDLARFRGAWFLAFREGDTHALSFGRIRVLRSMDGEEWESAALLEEDGFDLRDPHFSVDGAGRLELLMGGTALSDGAYTGRRPRVRRSADGVEWSAPEPILDEGDWLWRAVRADEGAGADADAGTGPGRSDLSWGVSYRLPEKRRWTAHLIGGGDGAYRDLGDLGVPGLPNEATLRIGPDGRALMILRREEGAARAWLGRSRHPYAEWSWKPSAARVGGPNFVFLPDGRALACCRFIARGKARAALAWVEPDRLLRRSRLKPFLELPSGGDCGYPGLVLRGDELWVSYYSSHESGGGDEKAKPKARIYLARVRLPLCRP